MNKSSYVKNFVTKYRKFGYYFTKAWAIIGALAAMSLGIVAMSGKPGESSDGLELKVILMLVGFVYGGICFCVGWWHSARLFLIPPGDAFNFNVNFFHAFYTILSTAVIPGILLIPCIIRKKRDLEFEIFCNAEDYFVANWTTESTKEDLDAAMEAAKIYANNGGDLKDLGFRRVKGKWKLPKLYESEPEVEVDDSLQELNQVKEKMNKKLKELQDEIENTKIGAYLATHDPKVL